MRFAVSFECSAIFFINRRFSSVRVLAPLSRLSLMDQKITHHSISFDLLSGHSRQNKDKTSWGKVDMGSGHHVTEGAQTY